MTFSSKLDTFPKKTAGHAIAGVKTCIANQSVVLEQQYQPGNPIRYSQPLEPLTCQVTGACHVGRQTSLLSNGSTLSKPPFLEKKIEDFFLGLIRQNTFDSIRCISIE